MQIDEKLSFGKKSQVFCSHQLIQPGMKDGDREVETSDIRLVPHNSE